MEARETTYKGKVYRSKTEAMFAMVLVINAEVKNQRLRIIYEPSNFETPDKYIPDFRTESMEEPFLADFTALYEVKPAIPSQSYIKYLEKQFKWIKEHDTFGFISFMAIYVFNPYDRIMKYMLFDDETMLFDGEFETPAWFNEAFFDIVLNHRFDLEPDKDY